MMTTHLTSICAEVKDDTGLAFDVTSKCDEKFNCVVTRWSYLVASDVF